MNISFNVENMGSLMFRTFNCGGRLQMGGNNANLRR